MKHTLTVIPASFSRDPSSDLANSIEADPSSPTVAEESSPAHTPKITTMNGNQYSHQRSQHAPDSEPMKSPCFVHSHLDKGASLSEWLRHKGQTAGGAAQHPGVTRNLHRTHDSRHHYQQEHDAEHGNGRGYATPSDSVITDDINDEDEYGSSLTKQLAETAVGVRKMSRELGECSGRS
jgi:NAD+ kinase